MPLHSCHPVAPHTKLKLTETYVSGLMMERAVDAVMRRVGKLDREHDIPYLAGYSMNGKIIYIDRAMPPGFTHKGARFETDPFLILHEEVEKTLIDQLGLHYLHAHQIATRAEQAAVRAAGHSWKVYDAFMQENVTKIGAKKITKVPADLDLKPYRDEHDHDILERMAKAVERGHHPKGHHPEKLAARIHAVHTEHKAHVLAKKAAAKKAK
jgi:hypothetical protein